MEYKCQCKCGKPAKTMLRWKKSNEYEYYCDKHIPKSASDIAYLRHSPTGFF